MSSWEASVRVTLWPACAVRFALTWAQIPLFVQVLGSIVVVVLVTLSRRVAVAQP